MAEEKQEELLTEEEHEQQEDKKAEYVAVEDTQEGEDERLAEENEDREETRRRRKTEKEERAARRKAAIERDKTELNFLRQRNEELEKRMMSVEQRTIRSETSTLQDRLEEALAEAKAAERIMAKAVEAGAGEDVTKAMRIRDEALQKAQKINYAVHQIGMQAKAAELKAQQRAVQPDPQVAIMARKWISENTWYNPKGADEDSKIVQAIDQTLMSEGYNPKTEDYWRELDKRVARRLPDKKQIDDYDDDEPKRTGRKGPMIGSSREHAPTSTRREVYVSPERKEAMIQAGVWDDPVLRQRYLKQYSKWDRENKSAR